MPSQFVGAPEAVAVVGIDRISFAGPKATRTPVVRFAGTRPITGVAIADFDGDGNNDIIFTTFEPKREVVVLLGDGKGGSGAPRSRAFRWRSMTNYDITVADVNGDGRPDVIVGYEAGGEASRHPMTDRSTCS